MKRHYLNHVQSALKRIVTSFVMRLHILGRVQLLDRHLKHCTLFCNHLRDAIQDLFLGTPIQAMHNQFC